MYTAKLFLYPLKTTNGKKKSDFVDEIRIIDAISHRDRRRITGKEVSQAEEDYGIGRIFFNRMKMNIQGKDYTNPNSKTNKGFQKKKKKK